MNVNETIITKYGIFHKINELFNKLSPNFSFILLIVKERNDDYGRT